MTIICPSCDTSYRISAEALGQGRTVRCARCRTEWFALGDVAEADGVLAGATEAGGDAQRPDTLSRPVEVGMIPSLEDATGIDAVDPVGGAAPDHDLTVDAVVLPAEVALERRWLARHAGRTAKPRRKRSGAKKRLRPVAVAAAVGVALCGLGIGERVAIVGVAPSLASLYAAIGLPVNIRGLSIAAVRSVERIEEGVPLLLVTGEVENVSAIALDVPRLRLAVMGAEKSELYAWTTVATRTKLAPGETAPFRARLSSPPADGRGISVRFLASRDLVASASR